MSLRSCVVSWVVVVVVTRVVGRAGCLSLRLLKSLSIASHFELSFAVASQVMSLVRSLLSLLDLISSLRVSTLLSSSALVYHTCRHLGARDISPTSPLLLQAHHTASASWSPSIIHLTCFISCITPCSYGACEEECCTMQLSIGVRTGQHRVSINMSCKRRHLLCNRTNMAQTNRLCVMILVRTVNVLLENVSYREGDPTHVPWMSQAARFCVPAIRNMMSVVLIRPKVHAITIEPTPCRISGGKVVVT